MNAVDLFGMYGEVWVQFRSVYISPM